MFKLLILLTIVTLTASLTFKPHIIFIVADDLGWNDVSWHNPEMLTPNLGNLAREGVILNQSYVQPVCTPSRTAFMSGYYPFKVGRQNSVIDYLEPTGLSINFTLLPEKLKSLGYSTHIVGKWHLGYCNWSYTPTYRGFDTFFGYYGGAEDYYTHSWIINDKSLKNTPWRNAEYYLDFRNDTHPAKNYNGVYSPLVFAKTVNEILSKSDPKNPLFLYLPFQSVHAPLQVPKRWEDLYRNIKNNNRRKYCGMVSAMDDAVGKIITSLKKYGFFNNSVIIFTTDNGGQTKAGGNNWPLRGNKGTLWEGGTRGPAFVYSPNLLKKRYVNTKIIHAVDWYPTILHLAGSSKVNNKIDGVNQWDVINNDGPSARSEFIYNIFDNSHRRAAIRVGDYKLIWGHPGNPSGWIPPPRQNEHIKSCNLSTKSIVSAIRLFNIKEDPTERNNLGATLPKVVELLKTKIIEYSREMIHADDPKDDPNGDPIYWNGVFSPGWCIAR
ncbi:arylsulfatase B-like [Centruroides vittatus]|uniref:arylsulfatase B-like n=1 Tax=Centruroides vittatus TaxID=120091 RepID=UPI00350FFCCB